MLSSCFTLNHLPLWTMPCRNLEMTRTLSRNCSSSWVPPGYAHSSLLDAFAHSFHPTANNVLARLEDVSAITARLILPSEKLWLQGIQKKKKFYLTEVTAKHALCVNANSQPQSSACLSGHLGNQNGMAWHGMAWHGMAWAMPRRLKYLNLFAKCNFSWVLGYAHSLFTHMRASGATCVPQAQSSAFLVRGTRLDQTNINANSQAQSSACLNGHLSNQTNAFQRGKCVLLR